VTDYAKTPAKGEGAEPGAAKAGEGGKPGGEAAPAGSDAPGDGKAAKKAPASETPAAGGKSPSGES
jgi:hypothetical protein